MDSLGGGDWNEVGRSLKISRAHKNISPADGEGPAGSQEKAKHLLGWREQP